MDEKQRRNARLDTLVVEAEDQQVSPDYVLLVATLRAYGFPLTEVIPAHRYTEGDTTYSRNAWLRFSDRAITVGDEGKELLVDESLRGLIQRFEQDHATPDRLRLYVETPTNEGDGSSLAMGFLSTVAGTLHFIETYGPDEPWGEVWMTEQNNRMSDFGDWLHDRWLRGED